MALVVEARNLRRVYSGVVEALRGIDLTVPVGEFFGLLGPNGAGKTTTIGHCDRYVAAFPCSTHFTT